MSVILDSVDRILAYILPQLQEHQRRTPGLPFVLGLTGLQGSGKTTWATALREVLERKHQLKVVDISLDDLYHTHENLVHISQQNPDNPLLQTRGQPGTHDVLLASEFFASLQSNADVLVPSFDKSKLDGQGDRVPRQDWRSVSHTPPIDVVIFEGWCLGFRYLPDDVLKSRCLFAMAQDKPLAPHGWCTETLATVQLEHLRKINSHLKSYNETFMGPECFHFFVHLDTDDLSNVYRWRLKQEHALWLATGEGMSDEMVLQFVRGYMPSYELYLDQLRREAFVASGDPASHLRILLDKNQHVIHLATIKS